MAGRKTGGGQESQGVEVALAPEELELDPMAMTQKYEEHVREQQAQVEKEDFSDMVAEHAAKQKVCGYSWFNLLLIGHRETFRAGPQPVDTKKNSGNNKTSAWLKQLNFLTTVAKMET